MTITTIKLGGYSPLALLIASVLSGCGGEGSNGESVGASNKKQPNPQATVAPADATFSTGFSEHYLVDLSSKVYSSDGSGFVLTDVEVLSDNVNCQVDSMSDSGFVIDASASKACNYRYFVAPKAQGAMSQAAHAPTPMSAQSYSDSAPSSAVARVAVSSSPEAVELTPISDATLIDTGISINIESKLAEVGITLESGFELTEITLPYGYSSVAEANPTNDRIIDYTPAPSMTGIDRVLYTYEDSSNGLVLMGVLDIAVGYEANQGFTIQGNPEHTDLINVNTLTDIDISDYVTSDDGDDYQLVYVETYNAYVAAKNPTDISNKTIEFEAAQAGYHYISFAVSDHNGAYDMGLLRVQVTDPNQSSKWDDISYLADVYTAPPTALDATNEGSPYDMKLTDSAYSPAIDMAGFRYPSAVSYCQTIDASLPTVDQLTQMTTDTDVQLLHNWPTQAQYLAYDEVAGLPKWVDLADGSASTGSVDPTSAYYVTCVMQGLIEVLPSSSTQVIANGVDVGSVFVEVKLGTEVRPNTIVTASVSSPNVTLESDTVTTDSNGIAEFRLTSFTAEIVTLTIDVGGITDDHEVKFIGDETTAAVTSEVTVNNASYNSVEGNQVTATLTDQNNNVIEGYSVGFDVSTENHPDTGLPVTPLLVEESAQTDEFGEHKVQIKWDSLLATPTQNMIFDVTSSYTTTTNTTTEAISEVTFTAYLCGGVVGDDDKQNAAGDCIKIAEADGKQYTGTPSVSFLSAIGYSDYTEFYRENNSSGPAGNFARLNFTEANKLCAYYNTVNLNGINDWRLPSHDELFSLVSQNGPMYTNKGWATYHPYWSTDTSSTPIGTRVHVLNLQNGNYGSYSPVVDYYVSCVSGS
ncbi:Ig-like domain-containing protein [Vibrio lentus]|uniref:Ig-like domain-containing protein n=1 Tax=Vibrio lentus TaxID=136468 RepID=UPI000C86576F|nr:DUF1566 domain-containing protein [Vibrio lentus]PMK35340.1 hypothetical protein BCU02_15215 [Vibrio lentus]